MVFFFAELTMINSFCSEDNLIVETEKGKYTIPSRDFVVGTCIATERCTELGAILAPFTEQSEFDIVMKAIKSCEYQHPTHLKWVGLLISKDNSTRVFTNGVKFEDKIHGDLYQENHVTMPKNCPIAILDSTRTNKLQISVNRLCKPQLRPYICFEQKKPAKSDAITSDIKGVDTRLFIAVGSVFLVANVFLVCFFVRKFKNLHKLNYDLKLKLKKQFKNGI